MLRWVSASGRRLDQQLEEILQSLLAPIRERRAHYVADGGYVMNVLRNGTAVAREITAATLKQVRDGLVLFDFASFPHIS